jgi:hypothetical protein
MTYCEAKHPQNPNMTCAMPKGHEGAHVVKNAEGWLAWPNTDKLPPALGVSVADGIGTSDKVGG